MTAPASRPQSIHLRGHNGAQGPAALAAAQPHQVQFYSANAEIYGQGEKARALYQVEFGAVRVYRLMADGRRQISAFHVAGEVFGFESDGHHHFFAEAICGSAVRIYTLPVGADVSREILPLALAALVRAQEHLMVVGRQHACERVAAFLLDMMDRQGELPSIELAMSRADIGDYLGLTIETVSRVFSKFRAKGYIRLSGSRSVDILKPEALLDMCV
ncbi:helix-turn-helix domain-containing protein [Nitratireductor mangrovi]|uniref:Helix-turn-helix domain-containing protein n=1 Tax=Nitratireductor mangrovi TaxID=2599600 RepID=A0A5B8KWG8_9HYPH|nr:helix-turn-helix domain-containing protein [Nitratireductor mangrovi]QDY99869.1 helix-turn-helix domain-containing protein [Nitratireductor mangrovi]